MGPNIPRGNVASSCIEHNSGQNRCFVPHVSCILNTWRSLIQALLRIRSEGVSSLKLPMRPSGWCHSPLMTARDSLQFQAQCLSGGRRVWSLALEFGSLVLGPGKSLLEVPVLREPSIFFAPTPSMSVSWFITSAIEDFQL